VKPTKSPGKKQKLTKKDMHYTKKEMEHAEQMVAWRSLGAISALGTASRLIFRGIDDRLRFIVSFSGIGRNRGYDEMLERELQQLVRQAHAAGMMDGFRMTRQPHKTTDHDHEWFEPFEKTDQGQNLAKVAARHDEKERQERVRRYREERSARRAGAGEPK